MESARALDACLDVPPRRRHPVRERHAPQRLCGRLIASAHRVRGRTNPKRLRFCAIAQSGAVQRRSLLTASNRLTPPSANDLRQLTVLRDAGSWLARTRRRGEKARWGLVLLGL